MKYFSYNHVTGALCGDGDAQESPEEPGVYLLPAWATFKEPPVGSELETAYFLNDEWVLKTITHEEVAVAVAGVYMPPDDKEQMIRDAAAKNIDGMARLLGFASAADGVSFAGEESQRGLDGTALRAWRAAVLDQIDILVRLCKSSTDPLPTDEQFNSIFINARFDKKLFERPTSKMMEPQEE